MTYNREIRNYYALSDAFQELGIRLFGDEWTGYEIRGDKEEDPSPLIKKRKPLEKELDRINHEHIAKSDERQKAVSQNEILNLNHQIRELDKQRGDISQQIYELTDDRDPDAKRHAQWVRYDTALGHFLRALIDKKIEVFCLSGRIVPNYFWQEKPEGFNFDLESSLIYWPSSESNSKFSAGRINNIKFDKWLNTIIPLVPHDTIELSLEQQFIVWFLEEVEKYDGHTLRDQYLEIAQDLFPGLSERAFLRIWGNHATTEMTKPGPRPSP